MVTCGTPGIAADAGAEICSGLMPQSSSLRRLASTRESACARANPSSDWLSRSHDVPARDGTLRARWPPRDCRVSGDALPAVYHFAGIKHVEFVDTAADPCTHRGQLRFRLLHAPKRVDVGPQRGRFAHIGVGLHARSGHLRGRQLQGGAGLRARLYFLRDTARGLRRGGRARRGLRCEHVSASGRQQAADQCNLRQHACLRFPEGSASSRSMSLACLLLSGRGKGGAGGPLQARLRRIHAGFGGVEGGFNVQQLHSGFR